MIGNTKRTTGFRSERQRQLVVGQRKAGVGSDLWFETASTPRLGLSNTDPRSARLDFPELAFDRALGTALAGRLFARTGATGRGLLAVNRLTDLLQRG